MPTPTPDKIPGDKGPDLFTMPPDLKNMIRLKSRTFFKDLLFLDKDFNSSNGAKQEIDHVSSDCGAQKLGWRMMCLSMAQIKTVIGFFKEHIVAGHKGAKNLYEKIEYYDEEEDT